MKLSYLIVPLLILIYLEVLWTAWIIDELFHKQFSNWQILGAGIAVTLLTPKKLYGIIPFTLLLCTIYLNFLR